MTAPRDPDRVIRAFLEEGATELPDRVFDDVRAGIDRTRQRTIAYPWRNHRMPMFKNLAGVALAIAMLAAIGLTLRPRAGDQAGVAASPGPSASSAAWPLAYAWPGRLPAGTYSTDFAFALPEAVTFTIGDGWEGRDIDIIKNDRVALMLLVVDNLFTDPCSGIPWDPPIGGSVESLADALASMPGLDATAPTATMLGGLPGRYLSYTMGSGFPCQAQSARIFELAQLVCDAGCGGIGSGEVGFEFPVPGVSHRTWILDPGGRGRLVLQAIARPDATQAELDDLQAVLDSIHIDRTAPVTPQPQPQPASS